MFWNYSEYLSANSHPPVK